MFKSPVPKKPYPELFKALAAAVPLLGPQDKTFALSLHDGHVKYGGWSEKQAMWAQKMIDKVVSKPVSLGVDFGKSKDMTAVSLADAFGAQAAKTFANQAFPPPLIATDAQMGAILNLFANAGQYLKAPAIKIKTPNGKLLVLKASKKIKGAINIVSDTSYPNKWYGNIDPDGTFNPKFGYGDEFIANMKAALIEFAQDPAGVAGKYGKLYGKCCFCPKGLTDVKSTSVGYGPICAQHYGLPWGDVSNGYMVSSAQSKAAIQKMGGMASLKEMLAKGGEVVMKDGGLTPPFYKPPHGALHEELKEEAAAAKEPGEKMVPVLTPEEFKRMQEKVEILF